MTTIQGPTYHPTYDPAASVLRVRGLGAHQPGGGIDLDVCQGEVVAVLGLPSSGKRDLIDVAAGRLALPSGAAKLPESVAVLDAAGTAEQAASDLAGALASRAELIVATEPYRTLDALSQRNYHRQLRAAAAQQGVSVLFATNDVLEAIGLADRIVVLVGQRVFRDVVVRRPGHDVAETAYTYLHALLLSDLGTGPVAVA
jgi:ABC-type nitrate/sulfonate/bicarbonate transport system ATPase subunit